MGTIQANLILEILGRPAEHVKEALDTLVTKLGAERGVKLIDKNCHEPRPVENSPDLFTTFAEVTLELESLDNYFGLLFAYMPSNIELIHPEKITMTNTGLNDLGNKLAARLHEYDAITKKALMEYEIVTNKLKEVAPHLFQKPQVSPVVKESPMPEKPKKTKKPRKKKI